MLALHEAAKMMGVSVDTVRRRIKKGEINAVKMQGPFGEQWFIPSGEIQTAQEIIDVIPVQRQLDMQQLASVLELLIEKRTEPLLKEIENLKNEVQSMSEQLSKFYDQNRELEAKLSRSIQEGTRENYRLSVERERILLANIRDVIQENKKPWWKFWG
jgi:excisionase family DNA binding protein